MKIGILTQPLGSNYGGILQNWALQQVLIDLGHQPVTIQHHGISKLHQFQADLRCVTVWLIKHFIRHRTRNIYILPWQKQKTYKLKKFVKNHIAMTPLCSPLRESDVARYELDAIIVGSDQTWRPIYNKGHLAEMFCDFLPESCNISRLAYAASFGVDIWEYDDKQTEIARNGISRFIAISVRERSGIKLCKKELGVEAIHVLDPTLLIEPQKYNCLLTDSELNKIPSGSIGVYILDITEDKKKIVEYVCSALGKKANWIGKEDANGKQHSVAHWLASFEKSDFIITDSFHGTAFSINFHRQFLTILNPERGVDRFTSLLGLFGLENRAIDSLDLQKCNTIVSNNINWHDIDIIKIREREKSLKFLFDNLLIGTNNP